MYELFLQDSLLECIFTHFYEVHSHHHISADEDFSETQNQLPLINGFKNRFRHPYIQNGGHPSRYGNVYHNGYGYPNRYESNGRNHVLPDISGTSYPTTWRKPIFNNSPPRKDRYPGPRPIPAPKEQESEEVPDKENSKNDGTFLENLIFFPFRKTFGVLLFGFIVFN